MSMMVSFVLSFFPRDVLDEILNLIGSVSEGFPSYSCRTSYVIAFSNKRKFYHAVKTVTVLLHGKISFYWRINLRSS